LGDAEWVGRNYFLVNQLIAAIPHGIPDSAVLQSRNLAASIAARDPKFQSIRIKIHNQPDASDIQAVESYIADSKSDSTQLRELLELLRRQYSVAASAQLAIFQKKLAATPVATPLNAYVSAIGTAGEAAAGSALSLEILRRVTAAGEGKTKLDMLDLNA